MSAVVLALFLVLPAVVLAQGDGHALPPEVMTLAINLPAILLGIGLHEWAHAWTAWKLGDSTPEEEGRLSLNPIDHLDPLGTILIVAGLLSHLPVIGWGKPVMIRPGAFRRPIEDHMKVALAGPLMNVVIAGFGLVAFHGVIFCARAAAIEHSTAYLNVVRALIQIVAVNLSLALFNMIPIPPLDGSKVLETFLSADRIITLREIEPYGIIIVYVLMRQGALDLPFSALGFAIGALMGSAQLSITYLALALLGWWLLCRAVRWRY